jgi:hypothetical protein
MFIELTESLRCPRDHDEGYLVCVPAAVDGRDVVRGGLGCPRCGAEYPILDRVAWFAPPEPVAAASAAGPLTADAAATFLALEGAGGYVLLVGTAGRLGAALAPLVPGVHLVAVNPPADVAATAALSVLRSPRALPVRGHAMRGVVVGADAVRAGWLDAAAATVLTGLRVVVEDDRASPGGITELARGAGVFVGERRAD